jgi:hypothetical protein
VRRSPVNQRRGNDQWINPLLKRLDLVAKSEEDPAGNTFWRQIEECELVERVGKLITEVNRAAGYHILELVDFLPPQKNILRVFFDRQRVRHNLEIVIREKGIVLMFSTTRRDSTGWRRYVSTHSMKRESTLVWEQIIHPEEILEQNIQAWISYLLSGLDKKFRLDQILHASSTSEAELTAALRKASA